MQQMLVVLSPDADGPTILGAVDNNADSLHSFLAPALLLVNGDESVQSTLNQTAGVMATLSDDAAKAVVDAMDITQLDLPGMASMLENTLGTSMSFEESSVLAISGWMYGLSQQYTNKKSDRPRDGETWDMEDGCLPIDEPPSDV